ncbi:MULTISPECIES: hypothetical protein [Microbacterium]|uniref:hypothetical protein n=1 Tax=Microbacterium TaxID=33882 RepID=UPI000D64A3C8|nr:MULTISPECIES: hypothetical protein [Microbacterium]
MNDTTYVATMLDAHRAADLRRDVEILARRAERETEQHRASRASVDAGAQAAASVDATGRHFGWRRSPRRSSVAAAR